MQVEETIVNGRITSWYVHLWYKFTRGFGFDSEKFRKMLKQFKFNDRLLTEDEIEEICHYAIYTELPPSMIREYERRQNNA